MFVRAVAVGAVASALTVGLASSPSAAATSPVDVGNRELSVTCVGQASPTVLLEAPLATDSSIWKPMVPLIVIVGAGGLEVPFATSVQAARALDALAARLQRETVALSAEGQLRASGSTHGEILQEDAQLVSDAIAAATMSALGRVGVSP